MKLMPDITFLDLGGGCPDGWGLHEEGERFAFYDPRTGLTTLYRKPTPKEAILSAHRLWEIDTTAARPPAEPYAYDLFDRMVLPNEYNAVVDYHVRKYGNTQSTDRLRSQVGHEEGLGFLTWGDLAIMLGIWIPEEAP